MLIQIARVREQLFTLIRIDCLCRTNRVATTVEPLELPIVARGANFASVDLGSDRHREENSQLADDASIHLGMMMRAINAAFKLQCDAKCARTIHIDLSRSTSSVDLIRGRMSSRLQHPASNIEVFLIQLEATLRGTVTQSPVPVFLAETSVMLGHFGYRARSWPVACGLRYSLELL